MTMTVRRPSLESFNKNVKSVVSENFVNFSHENACALSLSKGVYHRELCWILWRPLQYKSLHLRWYPLRDLLTGKLPTKSRMLLYHDWNFVTRWFKNWIFGFKQSCDYPQWNNWEHGTQHFCSWLAKGIKFWWFSCFKFYNQNFTSSWKFNFFLQIISEQLDWHQKTWGRLACVLHLLLLQ